MSRATWFARVEAELLEVFDTRRCSGDYGR